MGEVYLALDERLDRQVAIKAIRPESRSSSESRARFAQEARLAARLNHPAIVQIYDVLRTQGHDCIVMEYVEGETLRKLLSNGPLPLEQVFALANQLCQGLSEAHRRGVVHRDLKPENILITESGQAKMTDFGIAKRLPEGKGQGQTALTQTGSLLGTCRAMSPEQIQGEQVGPQSDLFSLGSLLYEALTGQSPFEARTELLSLNKIIHDQQLPVSQMRPEVPKRLSDLIDQLLEKEPLHRPRSAAEVAAALESVLFPAVGSGEGITRSPAAVPAALSGVASSPARSEGFQQRRPSSRRDSAAAYRSSDSVAAERRPLTVLCCELSTQSQGSAEADPEDQLEALQSFQAICTQIVEKYKGYPGQFLNSGMMAYFGYPKASEHAVQRSALASLEILSAMQELKADFAGTLRLQARLGIHNAPAIVGGSGAGSQQTQVVLGEGPRSASQLALQAEPDTVLASPEAQRLLGGLFRFQERRLEGDSGQSASAYRILSSSGATDRIEVALLSGLTPLVGREREMELLKERWQQACQGHGQVVLLTAEAGLGKSRLAQAFKEAVATSSGEHPEWRCSPYHTNSAYHPVITYLERSLQLSREDTTDLKLARLRESLHKLGLPLEQALPLLADLLSIRQDKPLDMSPLLRKQKIFDAILAWLLARAEGQTLLCLVEDIHWIDPSTLELLTALIDQVPAGRILLLCTFRPTFKPPWGIRSHISQLSLDRLAPDHAAAMIKRVSAGKSLPAALVEQLVQKTDGVPLYVEELTKMVLESGLLTSGKEDPEAPDALSALSVPATLHDSLLARLEGQGGAAKQVAQIGAIIGREFSADLLQAVSAIEEEDLKAQLDRLVRAELLFRQGFLDQTRYIFKHALIWEAAYQSLLKRPRQHFHSRIAEVLESRFPRTAESQPELLAHHWTQAGRFSQAVKYWQGAGQRAMERSAIAEAQDHIQSGLRLLPKISPGTERDEQELALQTALGTALSITQGFVPQVAQAFERALEICRKQEDSPQLFWALWGLRRYYSMRAEFETALQLGRRLVRLSQGQSNSVLRIAAHFGVGATLFVEGQFQESLRQFEEAIQSDSPQRNTHSAVPTGEDLGVLSLCFCAAALWLLGYPRQASQRIDEAEQLAQRISHSHSRNSVLQFRGMLAHLARNPASALEKARLGVDKARQQGSFAYLVQSQVFLGWAMACTPQSAPQDVREGIKLLRQSIAELAKVGSLTWRTYYLSLLAEACSKAEEAEEAGNCLKEALNLCQRTGENFYLAELQRLAGSHALARNDTAAAEEQFQRAFETAGRQGARILQLRSAVSLGHLWEKQGKSTQARKLIHGIYAGFEEGFDCQDLRQARKLIGGSKSL